MHLFILLNECDLAVGGKVPRLLVHSLLLPWFSCITQTVSSEVTLGFIAHLSADNTPQKSSPW